MWFDRRCTLQGRLGERVDAEIVPPKSKTTDREIVRSLSPEHHVGKGIACNAVAGHVDIIY